MNDRHPSGYPAYDSYGQQHATSGYGDYGDGDPLFGSLPGSYETGGHESAAYPYGTGVQDGGYDGGGYDTASYGTTTAYGTSPYDATGAYATTAYDTGTYTTTGSYAAYDTTGGHDTGGYEAYDPYAHTAYERAAGQEQQEPYADHGAYGQQSAYATTAYDTGTYTTTGSYAAYDTTGGYDNGGYDGGGYDSGAEATAIWSTTDQDLIADIPAQPGPPHYETTGHEATGYETAEFEAVEAHDTGEGHDTDAAAVAEAMTQAMPVTDPAPGARRVSGPAAGKPVRGRGRRRTAKRSALLTVAVPSVAAMGVCAAAAASVTGIVGDDEKDEATTQAAGDTGSVKASAANKKLDSQLAGLSADARDFGDRANRTQERIDLKERQALAKKKAAQEAARKEAMRPKFVLPVTEHGLSALFGQAGVNWMSVHTGIDFPVSYGTPVMSATDGTVRTQWNSAYGNMAIVTAPDGTETWYCHLSSTKIRSGSVKAGDTIAYSGNSGNSTGPHLHFEVRPGGDDAIDPIPWLRDHGLNPN